MLEGYRLAELGVSPACGDSGLRREDYEAYFCVKSTLFERVLCLSQELGGAPVSRTPVAGQCVWIPQTKTGTGGCVGQGESRKREAEKNARLAILWGMGCAPARACEPSSPAKRSTHSHRTCQAEYAYKLRHNHRSLREADREECAVLGRRFCQDRRRGRSVFLRVDVQDGGSGAGNPSTSSETWGKCFTGRGKNTKPAWIKGSRIFFRLLKLT